VAGNHGHPSYEKQQELLQNWDRLRLDGTARHQWAAVKGRVGIVSDRGEACSHAQVDETPWLVRVKEWMWVVCGVDFALFHADTPRAELETPAGQEFLEC